CVLPSNGSFLSSGSQLFSDVYRHRDFLGQPLFHPSLWSFLYSSMLLSISLHTLFVRVLSGQWFNPVLCCAMNLARLGFNMLHFGKLIQRPILFTFLTTEFKLETVLVSSIGPGADIIAAASLVYFLWHNKNTTLKQTNKIVDAIAYHLYIFHYAARPFLVTATRAQWEITLTRCLQCHAMAFDPTGPTIWNNVPDSKGALT
ncbi:hypothetical protein K438DRAFT_2082080, partial [Mycena galopus ATCC 62051]